MQNNSECTVFGKGSDELRLAALSSLDETAYNAWLATSFEPISATFGIGEEIYFFRDNQYFIYNRKTGESRIPSPIAGRWPVLGETGFEQIDGAFEGTGLVSHDGEDLAGKLFLFREGRYARLDLASGKFDPGYPRSIAEGWPGVAFERIDAALNVGVDTVYLFKGGEYIRFNLASNHAEPGYPELITRRWAGVIFDRINAAIYWKDGKVYFFKDDQYIRYDMTIYQADPGYPRFIVGSYVEDWKFFS